MFLIFVSFFLYFSAQLGRYSYTSNINLFIDTVGVTKTQAGLVSTLYFLAYGAGQIFNGIMCKRYNKQIVCFCAVAVSAAINLTVFFGAPFYALYPLWVVNGFAQSVLYPTLMLTLSENLHTKYRSAAAIAMSSGTTVGTFAIYGIGACFSLPENFKYAFLIAASVMLVAGVVWLPVGKNLRKSDVEVKPEEKKNVEKSGKLGIGLVLLFELSLFAFVSYAIGGGLGTWTPTIVKELFGLSNGMSAFLSAFLPFFAVFNAVVSEFAYKKCKGIRLASTVLFGIALAISVVLLFVMRVNGILLLIMLILLRLAVGAETHLMTAVVPLFKSGKCNAGFMSGFLNGICYLGNSISSLALGLIADTSSWDMIFIVFAVASVIPIIVSIVDKRIDE